MPRGFQIGRLFGTDIYATPWFLGLLGLVLYLRGVVQGAVFAIALVISLLVHEFGHVFAVRRWAGAPSIIFLWGMGGLCIHERVADPKARIRISLMGPAFELVLGGVALVAFLFIPAEGLWLDFLWAMVWINVVWAFANLLPILPLDGGQASQAALETRLGPYRARRITRWISAGTAAVCMALALYYDYRFAAIMCALLLLQNMTPQETPYD
jgi:stage IV sporulation protein FB